MMAEHKSTGGVPKRGARYVDALLLDWRELLLLGIIVLLLLLPLPATLLALKSREWKGMKLDVFKPLPANVNAKALQAASDWSFNRPSPEQVTLSLLIVQGTQIIQERYAPGVDMSTRTRTWSTAKSLASTLIGMKWMYRPPARPAIA